MSILAANLNEDDIEISPQEALSPLSQLSPFPSSPPSLPIPVPSRKQQAGSRPNLKRGGSNTIRSSSPDNTAYINVTQSTDNIFFSSNPASSSSGNNSIGVMKKSLSDPDINDSEKDEFMDVNSMSSLDSAALMTPMVNAMPLPGMANLPPISPSALPSFDNSTIPDISEQFNSIQMQSNDELSMMSTFSFASTTSLGMDSTGNDRLEIGLPSPFPISGGEGADKNTAGDFDYAGSSSDFLPLMPPNADSVLAPQHEFLGFKDMDLIEISLIKTCSQCLEPIESQGIFINGQFLHKKCYVCSNCNVNLEPGSCVLYHERLFCFNCSKFRKQICECPVCNQKIENQSDEFFVKEINAKIHKNCLSCFECGCKLEKNTFCVVNDHLLCKKCNSDIQSRLCSKCGKPIVGDFVQHFHKLFHPEHFTCVKCNAILYGFGFVAHHNLPYCFKHGDIYASTCAFCKGHFKLNETDKIKWSGKMYHNSCFVCRICGSQLDPNTCKSVHGRPHCRNCFSLRQEDGDIDQQGKSLVGYRHNPVTLNKKREKFQTTRNISIIYPQYGNNCFEVAEKPKKDNSTNFLNF